MAPSNAWRAHVLTLYPEMFPGPLDVSVIGNARALGLWSLSVHDIRAHGLGRHRTVDDTPAGGGPGMVLRADVIAAALDEVQARSDADGLTPLLMSPRGRPLTQARAAELAASDGAIFIAGRFEGVDQRVIDQRQLEEVSIGDFVMTGGELAAMAMIDACVRLLPGVLGDDQSSADESFSDGLLEYPQYTRPRTWEGAEIPNVLLSGNHAEIERWRRAEAQALTAERRPDLLQTFSSSPRARSKLD
ncbi:MAG: tRNA (guanosine(37)-N1)-methyltransferase TrmD [Pseudomonadota bacterium]